MEKARSAELTDFCLLVAAGPGAPEEAREAVRARFAFLAEGTREDLAAAVAKLVQQRVESGSGDPITVAIAVESDLIRGEVSDQGTEELGRGELSFEIPLAASA